MTETHPSIIVTTGDPAGIGPDIVLKTAANMAQSPPIRITAIGDCHMLATRAEVLGMTVEIVEVEDGMTEDMTTDMAPSRPGRLAVIHQPCKSTAIAGQLSHENGAYIVGCIDRAVDMCITGRFDAMVTAPVNKAVINQSGIPFVGHTEWIAARCHAPTPVMMLANGNGNSVMRICLLTNHIPLAEVPGRITQARLREVISVILADLRHKFNIAQPTLGVCGLNPHAGENGYMGREEIEIITPTLDAMRATGANIIGPIPADTAFTRARLASLDAVLAMYHDQGLPVSKHANFGDSVNITLGLPIIRTSVDHGTAIELAGTGKADESSLQSAIALARQLAGQVAGHITGHIAEHGNG